MAKLLIVDDDADLAFLVRDYFRKKGYEVEWAKDPVQGMELARTFKPDLAILDYHMPKDTGAHLFEGFRRNPSLADLPVIFMSGTQPPEAIEKQISSAERAIFLRKPVHLKDLLKQVEDLISGKDGDKAE